MFAPDGYLEKFHSLDALRFFAFFVVFMSHLPYDIFPSMAFLKMHGETGVHFFFTLSGFLITFLVISEKKRFGQFDFQKYMLRRILRIWPLYYLVLAFAFLTPWILQLLNIPASSEGYEPIWPLSAIFMENYASIYYGTIANVSPIPVIWSVCVEEHFYIVWGLALYFCDPKKLLAPIVMLILLANISRVVFSLNGWWFLDLLTNFDYFMYGAVPAVLYSERKKQVLKIVSKTPLALKIIVVSTTISFVFLGPWVDFPVKKFIDPFILGTLFSLCFFILLPKENFFRIGDGNLFSRFGKYTYGLYLLHVIIINLMIKLYILSGIILIDVYGFMLIAFASFAATLGFSILSFYLIEKPFLKLKTYQKTPVTE